MSAASGESLPSINLTLPQPEFVDPKAKEDRICPVCKKVLHQPMQTACGHRLCESCLDDLLAKDKSIRCPVGDDDCVILSKQERTVLPDFGGRKDLKKLEVYCIYKEYGCKEKMMWANLANHVRSCPHAVTSCSFQQYGCQEIIKVSDFKKHNESCTYRPEICQHCHNTFAKCKLKNHIEQDCLEVTVGCQDCGINGLKRQELEDHKMACPSKRSTCKFGCSFVGTHSELEEHDNNFMKDHLDRQLEYVKELEKKNQDLDSWLKVAEADRDEMKLGMNKLTLENNKLRKKVEEMESGMKQVQKLAAGNTVKTTKLEKELEALARKDDVDEQNRKIVTLNHSFKELESRLSSLPSMDSGYNSSGLSSDVSQHDHLLSLFNVRLAEVDLRLQMLETASYNGTLLWKIRGYNRRKADARSGKTISLYSQPFYTNPHGYKMCARVYLNGDGIGKGTHLSLFFVVMKGDYDALLPWPLRQKVTLMLLDQIGKRHLQDTFRPDPASSSFQKPQNEMNVASGCPLFVAHSVLEAAGTPYIRDDTIFIKVTVDTEGLETR